MAQVYSIATGKRIDTPKKMQQHATAVHEYKVIDHIAYVQMLADMANKRDLGLSIEEVRSGYRAELYGLVGGYRIITKDDSYDGLLRHLKHMLDGISVPDASQNAREASQSVTDGKNDTEVVQSTDAL